MPRAPKNGESSDGKGKGKGRANRNSSDPYIPRPPNAWILYRRERLSRWRLEQIQPILTPLKQSDISRMMSALWRNEPPHVREHYEKCAEIAKAEHRILYPDYKYAPKSKEEKARIAAEKREAKKREREEAKAARGAGRRNASGSASSSSSRSPQPDWDSVPLAPVDAPQGARVSSPLSPLSRGSGPSPPLPLDYAAFWGFGTFAPPSSSGPSLPSSPIPRLPFPLVPSASSAGAPSQGAPSPAASGSSSYASSSSASSFAGPSTLRPAPPPAYMAPSTFVPPVPSRTTSYAFAPSPSSSTPSDSPPSYTEGDSFTRPMGDFALGNMVPPFGGYGAGPGAFAPGMIGGWDVHSVPTLSEEVFLNMPGPTFVATNEEFNMNFDATSAEAIMNLIAHDRTVNSPPGEIAIEEFPEQAGGAPHNSGDVLAPVLDMREMHQSVEDHSTLPTFPAAPADGEAFPLEDFTQFINGIGPEGAAFFNPGFYADLAANTASAYGLLPEEQPQPFVPMPPVAAPLPRLPSGTMPLELDPSIPWEDQLVFEPIPPTMLVEMFGTPQLPAPAPPPSFAAIPPSALMPPAPVPDYPPTVFVDMVPQRPSAAAPPATGPARYMPPAGAAMTNRRRVGQRFDPSIFQREGSSDSA